MGFFVNDNKSFKTPIAHSSGISPNFDSTNEDLSNLSKLINQ